jgi:hypothetical protein
MTLKACFRTFSKPVTGWLENDNKTAPHLSCVTCRLNRGSPTTMRYSFAWSSFIALTMPPLAHTSPPSTVIVAPLMCELALLLRKTTNPAISSGFPSLLLGLLAANCSSPPVRLIRPLAILEGKNPGAIALTKMCLGPSSTAKFFARSTVKASS